MKSLHTLLVVAEETLITCMKQYVLLAIIELLRTLVIIPIHKSVKYFGKQQGNKVLNGCLVEALLAS